MKHRQTLTTGCKAFIDAFSALVPCRVLSIKPAERPRNYEEQVTVQVTSARPGYKRGETVTMPALHIVPRGSVYRSRQRCGQYSVSWYWVQHDLA